MAIRRLWRSLVGGATAGAAGAGAGAPSVGSRVASALPSKVEAADAKVRAAREMLLGATRSTNVSEKIADVLRRPVREIVQDMGFTPAEIRQYGNFAFDGTGTTRDAVKATHLWVAAGMKGDGEALYSLALCFAKGIALPKPERGRAITILEELCKQGHHWSHFALGNLLRAERDNPEAQKRAFELFKKAADLGVAPAYLNLASMYEVGEGTEQNEEEAIRWLTQAAKLGDPHAQMRLGYKLAHGEGVDIDVSKAARLFEESASSGKPAAQYNAGCAYFLGRGVDRDYARAAEFFTLSAEAGFFAAQVNLGNMYQMGTGVPQSFEEALYWYTQAAQQSDEALPMLESLKERMRLSTGAVDLAGAQGVAVDGSDGAVGAAAEGEGEGLAASLREVPGGVVFEQPSRVAGAETLDVKVQVHSEAEARDLIEELQGVYTSDRVMEVLKRREAATEGTTKVQSAAFARDGAVGAGAGDGGAGAGAGAGAGTGRGGGDGRGGANRRPQRPARRGKQKRRR